jgi:hypothetical protein
MQTNIEIRVWNPEDKNHFADPGTERRIIFKIILNTVEVERAWTGFRWLRNGEHSNEISSSVEIWELLNQPNDCQLLRNDSAVRRWLCFQTPSICAVLADWETKFHTCNVVKWAINKTAWNAGWRTVFIPNSADEIILQEKTKSRGWGGE